MEQQKKQKDIIAELPLDEFNLDYEKVAFIQAMQKRGLEF